MSLIIEKGKLSTWGLSPSGGGPLMAVLTKARQAVNQIQSVCMPSVPLKQIRTPYQATVLWHFKRGANQFNDRNVKELKKDVPVEAMIFLTSLLLWEYEVSNMNCCCSARHLFQGNPQNHHNLLGLNIGLCFDVLIDQLVCSAVLIFQPAWQQVLRTKYGSLRLCALHVGNKLWT